MGLTMKEIDILVNSAGISQHSLLVRAAEADVDKLIDTNLRSAIWGCKVVGKQMISRSRRATDGKGKGKGEGGCCIINVSSLLAQRAVVGSAVYSASKAGLLGRYRRRCCLLLL
jgi:3-oxoacyl-[acyl-carrier protein] reductase